MNLGNWGSRGNSGLTVRYPLRLRFFGSRMFQTPGEMPTSHSSPRDVSSSSFGGLAGRRMLDVDEHEDDDGDYYYCFTQQCNILFTIAVIFLSVHLLVSMAVFCETFISI